MTNQEACDCIKDIDDAQKAAKKLVAEAKYRGRSYDDISCIVVMF
jgi:serine/threonine protein phosphatase PrpC